jgi:hypothetical protein
MSNHVRHRSRWRKFKHEHKAEIFFAFVVAVIIALVALLMYMLTSPNWTVHSS